MTSAIRQNDGSLLGSRLRSGFLLVATLFTEVTFRDYTKKADSRNRPRKKIEKHVCPLQLEVIRRCVRLYANPISVQPGVTVLDPFMGIGSTAFTSIGGASPITKLAVEEPRNVIGYELKESYHKGSLHYVSKALKQLNKPKVEEASLFSGVASYE